MEPETFAVGALLCKALNLQRVSLANHLPVVSLAAGTVSISGLRCVRARARAACAEPVGSSALLRAQLDQLLEDAPPSITGLKAVRAEC